MFGMRILDEQGNIKMPPGQTSEILSLMEEKANLDGFTSAMLLREAYETDFEICDHRLPENQGPMSLVKLNPKEDMRSYSRMYETLRRYVKYDIRELFGYTPDQFLELPREYVEFFFRLAVEKMESKTNSIDSIAAKLEKETRGRPTDLGGPRR